MIITLFYHTNNVNISKLATFCSESKQVTSHNQFELSHIELNSKNILVLMNKLGRLYY
jgi:hypothetical protein